MSDWSLTAMAARLFSPFFKSAAAAAHLRKPVNSQIGYQNCPKCGGRDYRVSDRQMASPGLYQSRAYRLKWLCLTCGHRDVSLVEDPI